MTEANADYFYGRTTETAEFLRALANCPGRCPVLIGASGVGKSSVAPAGVLSALKSMCWPGADEKAPWPIGLTNSRGWVQLSLRPGRRTVDEADDCRDPSLAPLSSGPRPRSMPRKWAERLRSGSNTLADLQHFPVKLVHSLHA
jgi:hypothetical protein